jgi:UDP-glucose 4-epimerase
MRKKVFVTGGAGFIGSHTCVELLKENYDVMVFDNLSNGSDEALRRVETVLLNGKRFACGNIQGYVEAIKQIASNYKFD